MWSLDEKELVAIHSLTQPARRWPDGERRSAGDRGGRSAGAQGETRQSSTTDAAHLLYRAGAQGVTLQFPPPSTFFIGRRYAAQARAAAAKAAARGLTVAAHEAQCWEAAGRAERTERVQLQRQPGVFTFSCLFVRGRGRKLVAIQTEAAVRYTQPAAALHALCALHTPSRRTRAR